MITYYVATEEETSEGNACRIISVTDDNKKDYTNRFDSTIYYSEEEVIRAVADTLEVSQENIFL